MVICIILTVKKFLFFRRDTSVTVCPRSRNPFYIVSYFIQLVTTSMDIKQRIIFNEMLWKVFLCLNQITNRFLFLLNSKLLIVLMILKKLKVFKTKIIESLENHLVKICSWSLLNIMRRQNRGIANIFLLMAGAKGEISGWICSHHGYYIRS